MVFVVSHISGSRKTWCINADTATASDVLDFLREKEGPVCDVVLQCSGQVLHDASPVSKKATLVATLRLPGGKGGFGSMLRAIGAQIEKTTNREACRDLSGRRLRDINEEKRLKDFISKKGEREREVLERKKQKFEKLKETPKHVFKDESYYQQREIREKNLFDSLDKAFEKGPSSSSVKRHSEEEAKPIARIKKGRFMDDLDFSSDDSDDDASDNCERNANSGSEEDTSRPKNTSISSTSGVKKSLVKGSDGEETTSTDAAETSGSEEEQSAKSSDKISG